MNTANSTPPRATMPPTTQDEPKPRAQASQLIADFRKQLKTAGTTRMQEMEITTIDTAKIHNFLRALEEAHEPQRQDTTGNTLQQILEASQRIEKKLAVPSPSAASARTWSSVATSIHTLDPAATTGYGIPQRAQNSRKNREITVTIEDIIEREETRHKSVEMIVNAVKSKEPKSATDKVLAARKLPSGDVLFVTHTEEARISLEKSNEWLQAVATSAKVKRNTFPVFVHAVRVDSVDTSKQTQAATKIYEQNQAVHPTLEVVRTAWMKRALIEKKRYSSLILETSSAETANKLIKQGLVLEGEIKVCERFLTDAKVTQCFRCQKYGHVSKACKGRAACAYCAGGHDSRQCTQKNGTVRKCTLCEGNHAAWAASCRVKKQEIARAQGVKRYSPPLYQEEPEKIRNEASVSQASQASTTSWKVVTKNGRGRPTAISVAAACPSQTRIFQKRTRDELSPATDRSSQETDKRSRNSDKAMVIFSTPVGTQQDGLELGQ
jgi:phage gp45-like